MLNRVSDYTDRISKVLALCPSTQWLLFAAECCVDMEMLFGVDLTLPPGYHLLVDGGRLFIVKEGSP